MKARISQDNPFGPTRAGYAWEKVAHLSRPHVDFGCYQGDFLAALSRAAPDRRVVGIDVDREAIETGRKRFPHLELIHASKPLPLPFDDRTFGSMTLLDVLEHVPDQKALLDELRRVLSDDGLLVVTVPRQYLLSFLDLGNLKFRFPRLHGWFYRLQHSREEYDRRYRCNPDGLIGDVSAEKAWHEHFTEEHLAWLLRQSGLEVVELDGSAFFTRALSPAAMLLNFLGPARRLLHKLSLIDARRFASMNLFCTARGGRDHPPGGQSASQPPPP
jgi:ubiquinone/menaquinone biosynthesis C-methylase UbiE